MHQKRNDHKIDYAALRERDGVYLLLEESFPDYVPIDLVKKYSLPLSWTEDEKILIKDLENRLSEDIRPWYKKVLKKDWSHITTIKKVGIGGRANPHWVHKRGKDYLELEQDIEYFHSLFKRELEKVVKRKIDDDLFSWVGSFERSKYGYDLHFQGLLPRVKGVDDFAVQKAAEAFNKASKGKSADPRRKSVLFYFEGIQVKPRDQIIASYYPLKKNIPARNKKEIFAAKNFFQSFVSDSRTDYSKRRYYGFED
tara:strand:- start:356 stop:1117 length:762 start_codon:yes stop_codon:yes gene_type:complete